MTIAIIILVIFTLVLWVLFGNAIRPVEQNFLIKKGNHYCSGLLNGLPRLFINKGTKSLRFYVTFDKNCNYSLPFPDSYDINKVAGFSNGNHHKDSIRLGWYVTNNKLNLSCYYYLNGERQSFNLPGDYEFGTPIHVLLEDSVHQYKIDVDGMTTCVVKSKRKKNRWRLSYYLKPYFGGNNPAPHNMNIYIQEV